MAVLRAVILVSAVMGASVCQAAGAPTAKPAWVVASDGVAQAYTRALAELYPEIGSSLGLREYDPKAVGVSDDMEARERRILTVWDERLGRERAAASDTNLQIDLDILRESVQRSLQGLAIDEEVGTVPFVPVSRKVYEGLQALTDAQASADRRRAAVERFKADVHGFDGYQAFAVANESRIRAFLRAHKGRAIVMPLRQEVEKYLEESAAYVAGIKDELATSGRKDWQADHARFAKQVAAYDAFVRTALLPEARLDPRLPPKVYAFTLKARGIDASPEELIATGLKDWKTVYAEFEALARRVAAARGLSEASPRAVIRALKAEQLTDAKAVERLYTQADGELARIITEHHLVTLPSSPLKIRVASDAESKAAPVPHLNPPPVIDNHGERPEFVVPASASGGLPFDDFSYPAAAIVLTAHEGRPGHDLQFSSMLDSGTSLIRARYAFNNVNVEGWGLYAEDLVYPYLPLESQLVALQTRLWRIARMYLDPQIQTGATTSEAAARVFEEQLGLSPQMAKLEVERYTFVDPGQAPSYYYGLLKLRKLRERIAARGALDLRCFNDAVLAAGLMPIDRAEPLVAAAGCSRSAH